jgi:hypothetical protein
VPESFFFSNQKSVKAWGGWRTSKFARDTSPDKEENSSSSENSSTGSINVDALGRRPQSVKKNG